MTSTAIHGAENHSGGFSDAIARERKHHGTEIKILRVWKKLSFAITTAEQRNGFCGAAFQFEQSSLDYQRFGLFLLSWLRVERQMLIFAANFAAAEGFR